MQSTWVAPELRPEAVDWEQYERCPTASARSRRKKPPKRVQLVVGERQSWCCGYCDAQLPHESDRRWDHFVPFAYLGTNPEDNWILACNSCNARKGSKMFDTVADVREYLAA